MNKLYYDATTGYLCDRYPTDIPHTDDSPFIEVDDDVYGQTFACPYGETWAVIDGKLQLIENTTLTASPQYRLDRLGDQLFDLHSFLTATDYVVIKLSEARLLNNEEVFNALSNKYAGILEQREQIRQQIDGLQQQFDALSKEIEQ